MHTRQHIQEFLAPKSLAFAGLSRDEKKFSRLLFQKLQTAGFILYPVNPNSGEISGMHCYPTVSDLPPEVDRLYIVTGKKNTLQIVKDASLKGIQKIWIQQGSETPECISFLRSSNIDYIAGECLFMWTEPVEGFHKFHRNLKRLFGGLPAKK